LQDKSKFRATSVKIGTVYLAAKIRYA